MDFTENPDESKWRSKHKSIKGVLKEVSDVKSAICKSFRAYEKKRKYLASGKYDREPGWCFEHQDFCDVDSPCVPWDPIPANSSEGIRLGSGFRHHEKFLKVLDYYSLKATKEYHFLLTIHQDMINITKSGMWRFTAYSPQPYRSSIPGDFSDISAEELRYLRYTIAKEDYEEYEKTLDEDYKEMRESLTMVDRWITTVSRPDGSGLCKRANEVILFLNNPDGPWDHSERDYEEDNENVIYDVGGWKDKREKQETGTILEIYWDESLYGPDPMKNYKEKRVGRWIHYIERSEKLSVDQDSEKKNPRKLIINHSKLLRRNIEIRCILENLMSRALNEIARKNSNEISSEECESDEELQASESENFESEHDYEEGGEEVAELEERLLTDLMADLTCGSCKKYFPSKHSRIRHERYIHYKQGGFKCRKYGGAGRGCGKRFSNQTSLKYHVLKVHKEAMKCDTCGKVFSDFEKYRDHRRSELGKTDLRKKKECSLCKKLILRGNMRRHLVEVHNAPLYNPFQEPDIKNPSCAQCTKHFKRKESLEKHIKEAHSGQNVEKIVCDNCGKSFSSQRTLKRHLEQVHSPFYKTFSCDQCEKHFKRKGDLHRHQRERHSKGEVYSCPVCKKVFGRKSTLLRHSRVCKVMKKNKE